MTMLTLKNVTKTYRHSDGDVYALRDIDLTIGAGDFITVTGGSGSGKTTLLLCMAGLMRPTSGTITFGDRKIETATDKELSAYRSKHIGFVMQSFALIPYLTAIENVMLPLAVPGAGRTDQVSAATDLLQLVGLENRRNHLPRELSAGQQQRVAVARAMINEPSLILADEPTGNLDPALSGEIMQLFTEINKQRGVTIVMVTHSPAAAAYGNRNIRLAEGRILAGA
ncbi:MAG: ABC transporter ATP-binding protein [Flavipsychrobacter sp.]|nr:ABC transporter ATP-binding protein [Flavipsychrobacter sp.]